MRADTVELTKDSNKNKWLVRIQSGEEVIRRQLDVPAEADEQTLRSAAQKLTQDEGYEADLAAITVHR
jgi:hypothetical protein